MRLQCGDFNQSISCDMRGAPSQVLSTAAALLTCGCLQHASAVEMMYHDITADPRYDISHEATVPASNVCQYFHECPLMEGALIERKLHVTPTQSYLISFMTWSSNRT